MDAGGTAAADEFNSHGAEVSISGRAIGVAERHGATSMNGCLERIWLQDRSAAYRGITNDKTLQNWLDDWDDKVPRPAPHSLPYSLATMMTGNGCATAATVMIHSLNYVMRTTNYV